VELWNYKDPTTGFLKFGRKKPSATVLTKDANDVDEDDNEEESPLDTTGDPSKKQRSMTFNELGKAFASQS